MEIKDVTRAVYKLYWLVYNNNNNINDNNNNDNNNNNSNNLILIVDPSQGLDGKAK